MVAVVLVLVLVRCGRRHAEQLATVFELARRGSGWPAARSGGCAASPWAARAAGSDAMNSCSRQPHDLVRDLVPVVLPAEGDAGRRRSRAAGCWRSPPDGCSGPGSRSTCCGPPNGALGVDHPLGAVRRAPGSGRRHARSCSGAKALKNCSSPASKARCRLLEEQTPEQPRQHPHRQEEARAAGDPALAVRGETPPPGTTQCRCGWCSRFWPQVCRMAMKPISAPRCLRIGGDGAQGLGGGVEQDVVDARALFW